MFLFGNTPVKRTVADIIQDFKNQIEELKAIHSEKSKEAEDLRIKMEAASDEASNASIIASNISKLINQDD